MVEIKKVSEIIDDPVKLNVCSGDSNPLKVLYWQAKSELNFDADTGVKASNEQIFNPKARDFINLALENNTDLILTPEYSFPYKIINEVIETEDLWPKDGALWCLSSEGISVDGFFEKLDRWDSKERIEVYKPELLVRNNFINALIYLFKYNNKLYILPQFKIQSMSDPWANSENSNLSLGKEILIFDLNGEEPHLINIFLSFICADVLGINFENIREQFLTKKKLIFNPQLNFSPYHSSFCDFRKNILDHSQNDKIITLNWAKGTEIVNNSNIIKNSGSAFYKKNNNSSWLKEGIKVRNQNHKKGTFYLYDNHIDIWHYSTDEHIKLILLKKEILPGRHAVTKVFREPNTKKLYNYKNSDNSWEICEKDFLELHKEKLESIISNVDNNYNYPFEIESADQFDYFFGLCFGRFNGEELTANSEIGDRILVSNSQEGSEEKLERVEHYKRLMSLLKENKFPEPLEHFTDNHVFGIDESYPEVGKNHFNLFTKDDNPSCALAIITSDCSATKVDKLANSIMENIHPNYKDHFVLYYNAGVDEGYTFYKKHIQKSYKKDGRAKNITSFKGGE
jgi:hypothetical protein